MVKIVTPATIASHDDWLRDCTFAPSHHHPLVRSTVSGNLSQKLQSAVCTNQEPLERGIFPLIDGAFEPIRENLPRVNQSHPEPSKLVAEAHSFRQLSSRVFCPEVSLDSVPEYILFALIGSFAVVWPILAMLRVLARS